MPVGLCIEQRHVVLEYPGVSSRIGWDIAEWFESRPVLHLPEVRNNRVITCNGADTCLYGKGTWLTPTLANPMY